MEQKKCKECGSDGPFYVSNTSRCMECVKARSNANRSANLERARAYDRARHVGERKVRSLAAAKSWGDRHTSERNAHTTLNNAVRDGRVNKPSTCSACLSVLPSKMIQAHHDDYSKPLDVRWLCISCHRKHHARLRREAG